MIPQVKQGLESFFCCLRKNLDCEGFPEPIVFFVPWEIQYLSVLLVQIFHYLLNWVKYLLFVIYLSYLYQPNEIAAAILSHKSYKNINTHMEEKIYFKTGAKFYRELGLEESSYQIFPFDDCYTHRILYLLFHSKCWHIYVYIYRRIE